MGVAVGTADGVRGRRGRTARHPGRVTVHERFKKRKSAKPGTMLATYHDQYVRHGGAWLFAERRLEVIERG